jgi:hypothetical protein
VAACQIVPDVGQTTVKTGAEVTVNRPLKDCTAVFSLHERRIW